MHSGYNGNIVFFLWRLVFYISWFELYYSERNRSMEFAPGGGGAEINVTLGLLRELGGYIIQFDVSLIRY